MKEEIAERRKEIFSYYMEGTKCSEFAPIIAKKYDCTEDAIRRDWSRRREWMHLFVNIDSAKDLAYRLLMDYEVSIIDSYHLYEIAENFKDKMQAYRLRRELMKDKKEFFKDINVLTYIGVDYKRQGERHWVETDPDPYTKIVSGY